MSEERFSWPVQIATEIDLENYEVFSRLEPYVVGVARLIERADRLVDSITVNSAFVRAHVGPTSEEASEQPDFVQKQLPDGFYASLVELSRGPRVPWPEIEPSPAQLEAQRKADHFFRQIDDALFPEFPGDDAPNVAVVSSSHLYHLFKNIRFTTSSFAPLMKKGFVGDLQHPTNDAISVAVWVLRGPDRKDRNIVYVGRTDSPRDLGPFLLGLKPLPLV